MAEIIEDPMKRKPREPAPYGWEYLQFAFLGTSLLSWYAASLWNAEEGSVVVALVFTGWAALADVATLYVMVRWVRQHGGRNRVLLYLQVVVLLLGVVMVLLWGG